MTKHSGTTVVTDTYTYRSPGTGLTSTQIQSLKVTSSGYNVTYTYAYDAVGNILSLNDGSVTFSYSYDSLNQLRRENNPYANKTWIWEYDKGGNIISKTQYNYTTGTDLGEPTDTILYSYTDSAWGDLLTSYNGVAITYDGLAWVSDWCCSRSCQQSN